MNPMLQYILQEEMRNSELAASHFKNVRICSKKKYRRQLPKKWQEDVAYYMYNSTEFATKARYYRFMAIDGKWFDDDAWEGRE